MEDDLGGGDAQLQDAIIDLGGVLPRAQALCQVAVQAPKLQAAVIGSKLK